MALEPTATTIADLPEEEAPRVEASLRDVLAAADRLLALDLEGHEPAAVFSPDWPEEGR